MQRDEQTCRDGYVRSRERQGIRESKIDKYRSNKAIEKVIAIEAQRAGGRDRLTGMKLLMKEKKKERKEKKKKMHA